MRTSTRAPARSAAAGFTLAELAVTILIVGVTLVGLIQALNGAKLTPAHTRNTKVACQLALLTLAQIESGQYIEEDLDERLEGNYADEGYEDFSFTVLFGDQTFPEEADDFYDGRASDGFFDARRYREDQAEEERQDEDREDEDLPYEQVKIKVVFPKLKDFQNELVLERWIPWEQVYGPPEEEGPAQ